MMHPAGWSRRCASYDNAGVCGARNLTGLLRDYAVARSITFPLSALISAVAVIVQLSPLPFVDDGSVATSAVRRSKMMTIGIMSKEVKKLGNLTHSFVSSKSE